MSYQDVDAPTGPVDSGELGGGGGDGGYPPSYDAGASGGGYGSSEDEGFQATAPQNILRYVEIFLSMLVFSIMASVDHYDRLAQAENQVMIGVFAFMYCIVIVAADVLRVRARYLPNLDLFEFAFDLMFTVLALFGSMALAVKCNKDARGTNIKTCKLFSGKSSSGDAGKANGSIAMGMFLFFALIPSTLFSYRRIAATRG